MPLTPRLLLPTPMLPLPTYALSSQVAKEPSPPFSPCPTTYRLDPFPWPWPRVCTCHFLLALPNANCLTMRLSICYWSSDLLPPLLTCLCRPPPAKRRAIHLPNTDSQLPPWLLCSIRPRFPCSYSFGFWSILCLRYGWAWEVRWISMSSHIQMINCKRQK